ncbi:MAG: hypothetical protein VW397_06405, partial [Candidatus Margulisiibacteriota bacterium]
MLLLLRHLYHVPVAYDDFWLDSPNTQDPAAQDTSYLLSTRSIVSSEALSQPVCVLVHGFSASTFEFNYFKSAVTERNENIQFSTILMGGHGLNYDAFKAASYLDWKQPVIDEVKRLISQGYNNISLLGVSTGATVLLDSILTGEIDAKNIRQLIFIDPFVIPQNKLLFLTPYLRFMVSNTRSQASTNLELTHWYVNRPASALIELVSLLTHVRSQINRMPPNFKLPPTSVFAAQYDA